MECRALRALWLSPLVALGLACGDDAADAHGVPRAISEALPGGVAAMVGDQPIVAAAVVRVASAQGISPTEARSRLIQDALYAAHARELSGVAPAHAERAALARALLEKLDRDARAAGEPKDEEIARITEARWLELDRPSAARTSHAVVLVGPDTDSAAARALAQKIAAAVRGISDAAEFRARAKQVAKGSLEVRVEPLPAVTRDGRVVVLDRKSPPGPPQRFDAAFAAAANAIDEVGAQSPVTQSSFGFHVILLEEKLAEKRVPLEQRRSLVREEALASRAKSRELELEQRLRSATKIEIDRAAEMLTARVRVAP